MFNQLFMKYIVILIQYFLYWFGYLGKKLIHSIGYKQKTVLKNPVPQSKAKKGNGGCFHFLVYFRLKMYTYVQHSMGLIFKMAKKGIGSINGDKNGDIQEENKNDEGV